jgi:hypothetical protein
MPRRRSSSSATTILQQAREQTMLSGMPREFFEVLQQCAAGKKPKSIQYPTRKMATSRRHQFHRLRPLMLVQKIPGAHESTAFMLSVEEATDGTGWIHFTGNPDIAKEIASEVEASREVDAQQANIVNPSEQHLADFMSRPSIERKDPDLPTLEELAKQIEENAREAARRQKEFEAAVIADMKKPKLKAVDPLAEFDQVFKMQDKEKQLTEESVDKQLKEMIQANQPNCSAGHKWDITDTFCLECGMKKPE